MAGMGGIAPRERDLSRRRDRQAAWVLAATAAVSVLILSLLSFVVGAIAAAYAYGSGMRNAFVASMAVLCLAVFLCLLAGAGGGLDGGLVAY